MPGFRRFSQAISEGDGISVIVPVSDPGSAGAADQQGAGALVLTGAIDGLRDVTALPVLWRGGGGLGEAERVGADACVIVVEHAAEDGDLLERLHDEALELGLDVVVDVRDEEELELALERLDPEIVLLSSRDADEDQEALDRVLELLPDVPAGELAGGGRGGRGGGGVAAARRGGRRAGGRRRARAGGSRRGDRRRGRRRRARRWRPTRGLRPSPGHARGGSAVSRSHSARSSRARRRCAQSGSATRSRSGCSTPTRTASSRSPGGSPAPGARTRTG